jgi:cytochrome P450
MPSTALPPGPRSPSPVQAARFGSDPYGFLERCERAYGHTFTLRLPGDPPRVLMTDTEMVKQVLALGAEDIRSDTQGVLINIGQGSVLFQDGERHRRQRFAMHPVLHGEALASYAPRMAALTRSAIDAWPAGTQMPIHQALQRLAMDIFLDCLFGAVDAARRRALGDAVLRWLDATLAPHVYAASLLLTGNGLRRMLDRATANELAGARSRSTADRLLGPLAKRKADLVRIIRDDVAACRRAGDGGREDVLARIARAVDEDGRPLSDEDVIDQMVTLFVAGHETSSGTLAWCIHHLWQSPAALDRARAEVKDALASDAEHVAKGGELPYVDAVIRESMRLSPVAPAVSRMIARPKTIGTWTFPAGIFLWPCTYLVQRRPDLWPDPGRFDPERFLGKNAAAHEFMPWGGGRRRCIGAAFSAVEMRIILAEILARTSLRLVAPEKTRGVFRGITVVPSSGVPVVLAR